MAAAACDPWRIRDAPRLLRQSCLALLLTLGLLPSVSLAQEGGLRIPGQPETPSEPEQQPDPRREPGVIDLPIPAEVDLSGLPDDTVPLQRVPLGDGDTPDYIEAANIEPQPDGGFSATEVTLHVASLVRNGGPAVLTAQRATVRLEPLAVELAGAVTLRVEGTPLELAAELLAYDGTTQRLRAEALSLPVPLEALLASGLGDEAVRAQFAPHFRLGTPEVVYADVDSLELVQRNGDTVAEARGLRVSGSPKRNPDLYVTVREATYGPDVLELRGISVFLEGLKVASWPSYSRNGGITAGVVGFEVPQLNLQPDRAAIRQDVNLNFGVVQAETRLDYDSQRGNLLAHGYAYVAPGAGAQLGVSHGTRIVSDLRRNSIQRSDDWNAVYRQEYDADPWRFTALAEHGQVRATLLEDGLPVHGPVEAQRTHAVADVELEALGLGGDWYLALGSLAQWTEYEGESDSRYQVTGGRAGLIYRRNGFNHFVFYRHNSLDGTPLFSFDAVRERELDLQTRLSLIPKLNHIFRGVYDFELEDWDRLELASMLERDSYEVGFYWDFARDRAGLEFGLFVP